MNRPRFSTYVIGHPIVLLLFLSLFLFGIYRWTQDPTSWPLTAIAFGFLSASSNAGSRVDAYRSWKRAWDEMGGAPPAPTGQWLRVLGTLVIAAVTLPLMLVAAKYHLAVTLSVGGGAFVFLMLWRLRKRTKSVRKAKAPEVVTICVKAPALSVPTLPQAFHALPPHCRSVLSQKVP